MKSFKNKTAVVTGAGSGLGRALAVGLNRAGAHLSLCDLNQAWLEETRSLLENKNLKSSLHMVDVSSREQVNTFADEVLSHHGGADILINNAGISLSPKFFYNIFGSMIQK